MRITKTIAFKIWISFTLVMSLLMSFIVFYYPKQQKGALEDFKKSELSELANSISKSVENSLRNDDFKGLKNVLSRAAEKQDFEFVAVILDENGTKYVLGLNGAKSSDEVLKRDDKRFLYAEQPFLVKSFKGEVLVAFSRDRIEKTIQTLNEPIYWIIAGLLALSFIMFYFLANLISSPVRNLIKVTNQLKNENYTITMVKNSFPDEIGELSNSILDLQENLIQAKERNKALTDNLENEIELRTRELMISQKNLIEAQDNARISNFVYSFQSKQFSVSENFKEIIGATAGSDIPLSELLNHLSENDRILLSDFFEGKIILEDNKVEKDIRFHNLKRNTQITFSCIAKIKFNEQNEMAEVFGTLQDITYRKKIELELKELSLVAKNTSNCVIITDRDKKIKWLNDSALRLTGYSMDEVIGKSPKMFQFEKTDQQTIREINEKLSKDEEVSAIVLNRGKNGNEYWLELNIVPLRRSSGYVYGYMAVETDITQLKKSEESILKMNETLEQRVLDNTRKNLDLSRMMVEQEKLATIGEISAGIAHDLNTPLGAAKVGAENLKFLLNEIKEIFPHLSVNDQILAVTLAKKYNALVAKSGLQKLKDKAVMEETLAGYTLPDEVNKSDFAIKLVECGIGSNETKTLERIFSTEDPNKFIRVFYSLQLMDNLVDGIILSAEKASNVVKDVRAFINKGITPERQLIDLETNIQVVLNVFAHELRKNIQLSVDFEPNIKVSGFDVKLFQLWSNIIKNALDAMDNQHDKKLSISAKTSNNEVVVEFSNNGPKIPEDIIHNIFKKFFSTKREKNGTGLGLSIVKNVLDEHGASIQVESTDELTTFRILFPRQHD